MLLLQFKKIATYLFVSRRIPAAFMSSRVHESQLFRACTDTGQYTVVMLIVFPLSVRTLSVHRHEVFTFYTRGLYTHEHQPGQRQSGLKKQNKPLFLEMFLY